ncbi:tRNA pseudouridine(38-40) synthase [Mucilaginibacter gracilis]|uniref:tRNA pseudouridine synthase A n=1 Tax=Mucilaginibacter gracilis TaxID=423350 RepID=A0A495JB50_9SPHI|nr:tRNA pseudouridine(38-40) synthase TruA [Mucilaginibacter gracilis]RKR85718.1 tRNA pseudouridine(38-40) synthase [Mucilaginibacter gracilis]
MVSIILLRLIFKLSLTLHVAHTQRYFIELAYNGTNYHGWQTQPNAITVQQVLDKALATLLRTPIETVGCGRTDTGVHATQLFAHLDVEEYMVHGASFVDDSLTNSEPYTMNHELSTMNHQPPSIKLKSLNSLLPYDVAVKRIIPVHAGAHARFDATLRSYEYHVHFEKDPFLHNLSWLMRDRPDVTLMNQAANMIMEYTDFSCFSKSNTQVKTNNCKISRAEWVTDGDKLIFHISADRFLRNMVRAIVGTLIMVGKGEIKPEAVRQIIESKNRSNAGTSVPACGLYLTQVVYPYLPPNPLKGEQEEPRHNDLQKN